VLSVHLLCVGKLRESHFLSIENEYKKRLKSFSLTIHELKTHAEDLDLEAKEIVKKVSDISKNGTARVVLLTEKGKARDSQAFSEWLFSQDGILCLVIGGASGFGSEAKSLAHEEISLSLMTFPHQMARAILVEQLYRAQSINAGHPYHK
jgi:23S rRNA (pseudouridine1915-N3)-methyltransferase